MILKPFGSIAARLHAVVLIVLIGFGSFGTTAIVLLRQMERAYVQRANLLDARADMETFRKSFLESIVLLDQILFEDEAEAVPRLLSRNEDTLASFSHYQIQAEAHGLRDEVHAATEHEPVVFRLHNDFPDYASTSANLRSRYGMGGVRRASRPRASIMSASR